MCPNSGTPPLQGHGGVIESIFPKKIFLYLNCNNSTHARMIKTIEVALCTSLFCSILFDNTSLLVKVIRTLRSHQHTLTVANSHKTIPSKNLVINQTFNNEWIATANNKKIEPIR